MNVKIYCPDIECDSCVRVIRRNLEKLNGINKISINKDSIDVHYNQDILKEVELLGAIKKHGYRASLEPFQRKSFRERFRDFRENKHKYEVEYTMVRYSLFTFIILAILEIFGYFAFFNTIPNFLGKYGWWIFYSNLAIISVGAAMWHLKSYRGQVTSMVGMMIGMTFGMQTGLMIGAIIGATNGIFIGGMAGMLSAVFVGGYNGKCCGIMGVLEGMMAGLMNGAMGSMIGVMFFADHILWFMPFFIAINLVIMWGLSYMLYEEFVENNPKTRKAPIKFITFLSYCFMSVLILTLIMVYAPKSGLARF
ncbi:MAG TPA: cation transporter [Candidatus Nanoarchaeia archaeon]|nr:cation transporter [Candidatus Nanoarchaeia archaeon]